MAETIRTRFAPSPTGFLHIGGLRTALYAYAMAKHVGGEFILRIEDTDQKRQVEGAVDGLKSTLTKFGLNWDKFYLQSQRKEEGYYAKAAEKLLAEGNAFYCQCNPKNAKNDGYSIELRDPCRTKSYTSGAVKLKVPEGKIVKYYDFVHKKEISWNTDTIYDATLLKSDGFPTYHLAAMTDDIEMQVTHILRGHDWLPSTPIHLLVFDFLAGRRPEIGHLTDILSSETGKKLSKRRDSVFVEQFLDDGYLPEALLNFVMLLGWAPNDNKELFTLDEFVKDFNPQGFQEANPRFFTEKLDWFNGYYLRNISEKELISKFALLNPEFAKSKPETQSQITSLVKDRIKKISDFNNLAGFFFEYTKPDAKVFNDGYKDHLKVAADTISGVEKWTLDQLNNPLMEAINKNGFKVGDFFMTLRVAVAGSKYTPPINDSIIILGKEETLKRINSLL